MAKESKDLQSWNLLDNLQWLRILYVFAKRLWHSIVSKESRRVCSRAMSKWWLISWRNCSFSSKWAILISSKFMTFSQMLSMSTLWRNSCLGGVSGLSFPVQMFIARNLVWWRKCSMSTRHYPISIISHFRVLSLGMRNWNLCMGI